MKYLTILVLLFLNFHVLADMPGNNGRGMRDLIDPNLPIQETGWKGSIRPYLEMFLGEETTNSLIGSRPAPDIPQMELPPIPKIEKSATDLKTYDHKNEPPNQGAEYLAQPKEKLKSFDLSFVQELFWAARRTKPTDEDVAKWMNALEQGASREGIYRAVVLDEVYATLENYEDRPSDNLIKFMIHFSEDFLHVTYKEDTLKKTNLFMMKRILSERVLDVLDAYLETPENLFKWYAVVSASLAKDYPQVWNNQVRSSEDSQKHFDWAHKVPIQVIKSEILIKIHFVMNSLQKI